MSNSKWLKFFRLIIDARIEVTTAQWTIINGYTFWEQFPALGDLMSSRFADGRFQLLEYRWIERVLIPHSYRVDPQVGLERDQDTAGICEAAEAAGQFPLELTNEGLLLVAYTR